MQTAKLFKNGDSQAINLPKNFHIEGEEVYIKSVGNTIVLIPKLNNKWETFISAINGFSDDFFPNGRLPQGEQSERSEFI